MKTLTYKEIKPYITDGLVTEQGHPENDRIRIFNYTQECQFSRKWDDVTLQCRGLIMNVDTDEIIARPFPKFFNYDEHIATGGAVPLENPMVYEKFDGSLGILYFLDGQPWISTRGSFTSDQALWATQWFRKNVPDRVDDGLTHLFEIIYPQNRIVVNYDFSGLVFLAALQKHDGKAVSGMSWSEPLRNALVLPVTDVGQIKGIDSEDGEGYVLHFPMTDMRLKIKFPTYVKLHKIMTGLSEKGIWELLREKGIDTAPGEIVEDVPDEFFKWLNEVVSRMQKEYYDIRDITDLQFVAIKKKLGTDASRKEYADEIKKMQYPALGFAMLDNRPADDLIFKMIRPRGAKTFAVEEC